MNGRVHRRLAALKSKRLQQFPCCERAQRGIKTSAVGSFVESAALCANGRFTENAERVISPRPAKDPNDAGM